MSLSICLSVHNRHELLERAICSWKQQQDQDFEVIMVDDASDPHIAPYLARLGVLKDLKYVEIIRSEIAHGSHTWGYNECLDHAQGDVILFTHPEIMLPPAIVGIAKAQAKPHTFVAFKPLWITEEAQAAIWKVNWQEDCRALTELEELYCNRAYPPGLMRTWNRDQETRPDWESTTTFAMLRDELREIGGFNEFDSWGPDDPDFLERRRRLGIITMVVMDEFVFHQWHGIPELDASDALRKLKEFWAAHPEIKQDPTKTNSHIDFGKIAA